MIGLHKDVYGRIRRGTNFYIKPFASLLGNPSNLFKAGRIFAISRSNRRFLSTLPRSGTHYITCLLTSALDIANGGTGEYCFINNKWVHNISLLYPATVHNLVEALKLDRPISKDLFMFSHHPIQKTNMFDINSMKVVFTVRSIPEQLESWLLHTSQFKGFSENEFIEHGYIEKTIDYFNYWGDFISDSKKVPGRDYVCIKYEEMVSEPMENLLRIVNLWDLHLDKSSLEKAIDLCSREKMKAKIQTNLMGSNMRLTVRDNRGKLFSEESVSYIKRCIDKNLKYDFGYSY
ncbi:MAG: sulfotransferase domain-containing protein [Sedimentisphaerales bacterium]|nr:sulfotransferase domain-containing protein [Sedimentisphaerales bacterium]